MSEQNDVIEEMQDEFVAAWKRGERGADTCRAALRAALDEVGLTKPTLVRSFRRSGRALDMMLTRLVAASEPEESP